MIKTMHKGKLRVLATWRRLHRLMCTNPTVDRSGVMYYQRFFPPGLLPAGLLLKLDFPPALGRPAGLPPKLGLGFQPVFFSPRGLSPERPGLLLGRAPPARGLPLLVVKGRASPSLLRGGRCGPESSVRGRLGRLPSKLGRSLPGRPKLGRPVLGLPVPGRENPERSGRGRSEEGRSKLRPAGAGRSVQGRSVCARSKLGPLEDGLGE